MKLEKRQIEQLIANGYAETHVGYHADYRMWNGEWRRGAYAQIAAPYGGTIRIYAPSYEKLKIAIRDYWANDDESDESAAYKAGYNDGLADKPSKADELGGLEYWHYITGYKVGDKVRLNPDYSLEEIEKVLNIPIDILRDIRQDNLVGQVTAIVAGDYDVEFPDVASNYLFIADFLVPAELLVDVHEYLSK